MSRSTSPGIWTMAGRNVRRSVRSYGIYMLTLVFSVCIFYAFNSISAVRSSVESSAMQDFAFRYLDMALAAATIVVSFILAFLILYANRFILRRRKREFGTYLILGMPRGRVALILLAESFLVGLAALVVGLLIGLGLSQVLIAATQSLIDLEPVSGTTVHFSGRALAITAGSFALMFGIALLFNVRTIAFAQLLDLLYERQRGTTRRVPLWASAVMCLVSLVLIGWAYQDLLHQGLAVLDKHFLAELAVVSLGTVLLLYSVSGFFLQIAQVAKGFYQRGLTTFVLRQLSDRMTTAIGSVSVVSLVLFFGIGATSVGFAVGSGLASSVEKTTVYDVSIAAQPHAAENLAKGLRGAAMESTPTSEPDDLYNVLGEARTLVGEHAQLDYYALGPQMAEVLDSTDFTPPKQITLTYVHERPVEFVSVSQYNTLARLAGASEIHLAEGQAALWWDFDGMTSFWQAWQAQHPEGLALPDGTRLPVVATTQLLERTADSSQAWGMVIVPDEVLTSHPRQLTRSVLNGRLEHGRTAQASQEFLRTLAPVFDVEKEWTAQEQESGPIDVTTFRSAAESAAGMQTVMIFLAIYVGLVFLLASAAILGIQQVSDVADHRQRYDTLWRLGVSRGMLVRALVTHISAYFAIPLVVALVHTGVVFTSTVRTISAFATPSVVGSMLISAGITVALYGGYCVATCLSARTMVLRSEK